jgi:hypothetical protein
MTGAEIILEERTRQIIEEGYTPENDQGYTNDELVNAAESYLCTERYRTIFGNYDIPLRWPWEEEGWKPTPEDRIRELAKAGALIAAEIDRRIKINKGLKSIKT